MTRRQVAVLILRDVLGFQANEVADMLESTNTASRGAGVSVASVLEYHD